MRITYLGKNEDEDRNYREAYIYYDGKKEQEKADEIFDSLIEKGWKVEQEEECATIRVYDKSEYKELLEDYKEAKRK